MPNFDTELERIIEAMPHIRKLIGKQVNLGVTDLTKVLYYDQGTSLSLGIETGDKFREGSLPSLAIRARRRVAKYVPEKIYGKSYKGVAVPIKSNNMVIGTYFVSQSLNMSENSTNSYSYLTDFASIKQQFLERQSQDTGAFFTFNDLIFRSKKVENLVNMAKRISSSDATVLIQGESGTGKEIFAQAIHNYGSRQHGPFVALNCASVPRDLIQSELFGYEEGSFTGARKEGKKGLFETANGGTIFLDEIGDLPLVIQGNLLRVLQEKKVVRIGGYHVLPLDIRVITATNKNLQERIKRNLFREDLFYRLNTTVLSLPPLRERREDIEVLFNHFIEKYKQKLGHTGEIKINPKVRRIIAGYDWPGNVRELENTIVNILSIVEGSTISEKHLPAHLFSSPDSINALAPLSLDELERQAINKAFSCHYYNVSRTARALGISRPTLYRKMKKYDIKT